MRDQIVEETICAYCLQGFNEAGYCSCGSTREDNEAWREQGRDWAKEYLPEGWHEYHWQILKHMDGLTIKQGQTIEIDSMAVIGRHPAGWYGVVVCESFDPPVKLETLDLEYDYEIFNFYPPDEQPQVGPFATEEEVTQAILHRLAQLEGQLEPIPPLAEEEIQAVKDRFAQRQDRL